MVAKFSSIVIISVIVLCVALAMVEGSDDASDEQQDVRVLDRVMKRWP